ncbi:MAG: hypothetical protein V4590_07550 [Bacteroidota bacterium]
MNHLEQAKDKPLECPVPHQQRKGLMVWFKRLGWAGFLFFLIKGLLWLIVPYLIAKGFFQ